MSDIDTAAIFATREEFDDLQTFINLRGSYLTPNQLTGRNENAAQLFAGCIVQSTTDPLDVGRLTEWARKACDAVVEVQNFQVHSILEGFKARVTNDLSRPLPILDWRHGRLSARSSPWKSWYAKLEKVADLTDGWNGYKAPAPHAIAVENAKKFLAVMEDRLCLPTRIAASAVGGVGITRRIREKKVYVEFLNNGLISALFANDNDHSMYTRSITTDGSDCEHLISAAEDYLSG